MFVAIFGKIPRFFCCFAIEPFTSESSSAVPSPEPMLLSRQSPPSLLLSPRLCEFAFDWLCGPGVSSDLVDWTSSWWWYAERLPRDGGRWSCEVLCSAWKSLLLKVFERVGPAPVSRSSMTRSIGILPFRQLMYRWQKLSHSSWTFSNSRRWNRNTWIAWIIRLSSSWLAEKNGFSAFVWLEKTRISSLKDSEEHTSPPAILGSRGVHVASSHFSKISANRGNNGCP